jgi:hypothetical protein
MKTFSLIDQSREMIAGTNCFTNASHRVVRWIGKAGGASMSYRTYRKSIFCSLLMLLCLPPGICSQPQAQRTFAAQRVAAPAEIPCSRDHLTLYNGRVSALSRSKARTTIRIHTDYDTTEQVTLSHPKTGTPLPWFRLNGAAFRQGDWSLIEARRNRLKRGVKANIWVCDDGSNPIVDWQTPGKK